MIVLSGNIDTRSVYAAKFFHEGYAKQVYLTKESDRNGRYSAYIQSRNAYAKQYLNDLGVPAKNLPGLREEGVTSTFDEAYDAVLFLKKNAAVKHVILVTDTAHTYAFKKILGANNLDYIQLEMAAAPNDIFNEKN